MINPMIVFSSVTKAYEGHVVLDHVNFRIDPGEFVFITGPSGAGKSTIVHLLIGGDLPTGGKVEIDGIDLAAIPLSVLQIYRRRAGVLFQDYKLLSDRTVEENVAFAMEVCGDSDAAIRRRVDTLLKQLNLQDRRKAFPHQLSGGEQARTALARALVHQPMVLIADEPTGNIDPAQTFEILELLKEVNRSGMTVIIASHDQLMVDAMKTRVLRLDSGKLIRDSIGGYEGGRQTVEAGAARKHHIFEGKDRADPDPGEAVNVRTNEQQSRKQKRKDDDRGGHIRPIAI